MALEAARSRLDTGLSVLGCLALAVVVGFSGSCGFGTWPNFEPPPPSKTIASIGVPEYPGAQVISKDEKKYTLKAMYKVNASPQAIIDFYRAQLPAYGWEGGHVGAQTGRLVYYYHIPEGRYVLTIDVTGGDEGSSITVEAHGELKG